MLFTGRFWFCGTLHTFFRELRDATTDLKVCCILLHEIDASQKDGIFVASFNRISQVALTAQDGRPHVVMH